MPRRRSFRARAPLRQQDQPDQPEIADQEVIGDVLQHALFSRRADMLGREVLGLPLGVRTGFGDTPSRLIKAEQGQRRHQHRCRQQEGRGALEKYFHPQPEIQTDAAMNPGDDQNGGHQPDPVRLRDPERVKLLWIEFFIAEQRLAETCADDMGGNERRDAEAEHELQRLDRLPVKLPALVQRPDPETGVNRGRGIEHDRDRQKLPEQGVVAHADGKGVHRDIAERMVQEMADQIGVQHHAAGKTDLPQPDAAGRSSQSLPIEWAMRSME